MGRQMPVECEHGVIVDGGDFATTEICEVCDLGESCDLQPTLRDQLAIAALQGWLASYGPEHNHPGTSSETCRDLANLTYKLADAMLQARTQEDSDA